MVAMPVTAPIWSGYLYESYRYHYIIIIEAYGGVFSLNGYVKLVIQAHFLLFLAPICPIYLYKSYGTHYINHLTAYGACLLGSKVTVVTLLEVNTYLRSCLHLETIESFTSLRNYCFVALCHY